MYMSTLEWLSVKIENEICICTDTFGLMLENLLNVEMCGYFLSQTEHKAPDNIFQ